MPSHFTISTNIFCIIVYIYIYFILINSTSYFMTGPLYCNAEKQFAAIVAENSTSGFSGCTFCNDCSNLSHNDFGCCKVCYVVQWFVQVATTKNYSVTLL